jgi:hypothetical protein
MYKKGVGEKTIGLLITLILIFSLTSIITPVSAQEGASPIFSLAEGGDCTAALSETQISQIKTITDNKKLSRKAMINQMSIIYSSITCEVGTCIPQIKAIDSKWICGIAKETKKTSDKSSANKNTQKTSTPAKKSSASLKTSNPAFETATQGLAAGQSCYSSLSEDNKKKVDETYDNKAYSNKKKAAIAGDIFATVSCNDGNACQNNGFCPGEGAGGQAQNTPGEETQADVSNNNGKPYGIIDYGPSDKLCKAGTCKSNCDAGETKVGLGCTRNVFAGIISSNDGVCCVPGGTTGADDSEPGDGGTKTDTPAQEPEGQKTSEVVPDADDSTPEGGEKTTETPEQEPEGKKTSEVVPGSGAEAIIGSGGPAAGAAGGECKLDEKSAAQIKDYRYRGSAGAAELASALCVAKGVCDEGQCGSDCKCSEKEEEANENPDDETSEPDKNEDGEKRVDNPEEEGDKEEPAKETKPSEGELGAACGMKISTVCLISFGTCNYGLQCQGCTCKAKTEETSAPPAPTGSLPSEPAVPPVPPTAAELAKNQERYEGIECQSGNRFPLPTTATSDQCINDCPKDYKCAADCSKCEKDTTATPTTTEGPPIGEGPIANEAPKGELPQTPPPTPPKTIETPPTQNPAPPAGDHETGEEPTPPPKPGEPTLPPTEGGAPSAPGGGPLAGGGWDGTANRADKPCGGFKINAWRLDPENGGDVSLGEGGIVVLPDGYGDDYEVFICNVGGYCPEEEVCSASTCSCTGSREPSDPAPPSEGRGPGTPGGEDTGGTTTGDSCVGGLACYTPKSCPPGTHQVGNDGGLCNDKKGACLKCESNTAGEGDPAPPSEGRGPGTPGGDNPGGPSTPEGCGFKPGMTEAQAGEKGYTVIKDGDSIQVCGGPCPEPQVCTYNSAANTCQCEEWDTTTTETGINQDLNRDLISERIENFDELLTAEQTIIEQMRDFFRGLFRPEPVNTVVIKDSNSQAQNNMPQPIGQLFPGGCPTVPTAGGMEQSYCMIPESNGQLPIDPALGIRWTLVPGSGACFTITGASGVCGY